jgi:hypothetical protein
MASRESELPQIPFGPYTLSRLIVGANPINGGSHLSRFVNLQMKRYFSRQRVMTFLRDCEREGINTWQSGPKNLKEYGQHRKEGGGLQYISLGHDEPGKPDIIPRLVKAGAIAIAHHGEVTDRLFKSGRMQKIGDFLARVHDAGLMAGISTHMPAVVEDVESRGWEVDFYMTCVYERHRTRQELRTLLGYVPLPEKEVYLEEDPPRMYRVMRATPRPCLAFKILAAGRLCDKQELVETAFREALSQIKANDALIVGMYPEWEDQVRLNADYVRRYSARSRAGTHPAHVSAGQSAPGEPATAAAPRDATVTRRR